MTKQKSRCYKISRSTTPAVVKEKNEKKILARCLNKRIMFRIAYEFSLNRNVNYNYPGNARVKFIYLVKFPIQRKYVSF